GLPANNEEVLALALEALDGPLMRGAVHALIGDVEVPLIELLLEIHHVHEAAAGREVPLDVLHARFDLALRLRAIRPAELRLKAPVLGEGLEGRVPDPAALIVGIAHRARPVVQVLPSETPEMLEGPLVRLEKLPKLFVRAGVVEAAPAKAEGQNEKVQRHRLGAKVG